MGTRYICDVCGKEYDIKGCIGPDGFPVPAEFPDKWAIISYYAPKEPEPRPEPKPGQIGVVPVGRMPKGFLVCSQACAEKALDEAKEQLRQAFKGES